MSASSQCQDEAILRQEEAIRKDIEAKQPVIDHVQPVSVLAAEYRDNAVFSTKLVELGHQFACIRRVRGDGNCFFRSFLFSVFSWLREHAESAAGQAECARLLAVVEVSKAELLAVGYSEFVIDDFWEVLLDEFKWVRDAKPSVEEIAAHGADPSISNYVIMYARFMASGFLKRNRMAYEPFLPQGYNMDQFCLKEVDRMGCESDHLHVLALASVFGVNVCIRYLDQSDGPLRVHTIPEEHANSPIRIDLLYRPGHYDVLLQPKSK